METDNVRAVLRKAKDPGMVDEDVFMSKTIIYHGSNVAVPNPKILINGYYKDFGYGFYCTNFEKQAKHKIVFCTEVALSTLTFEGSVTL